MGGMILNNWTKRVGDYCKPMLWGFLFFVAILFVLTLIYATSQLQPLTGGWSISVDGQSVDNAFPVSHVLGSDEEIVIKRTVNLPSNRDFLTFSVYPTIQGELYVDGHFVAEIVPKQEMQQNTPPYLFLSYQLPEELIKDQVEVEIIAKGPQGVFLSYPPMLANAQIIKQSTFRVHFVESYIFILAIGVQLVIIFLMFVIGNNMRSLRVSYLNIGIGELLQAIYLAFIVLAFNTTLFQDSVFFNYFVPLLMMASFIFLFQGLVYYILKRFQFTRMFWIGIPIVLLFYFIAPFPLDQKHQISVLFFLFMNLYMIDLSVRHTKIKLLQISLFILFFSIVSDFYIRSQFHIFPLPTMQQNALMIMSFVFGSFFTYQFIKNYRGEKKLRMELSESLEEVRAVNEELETSYQEIEALNNTLEEKVLERTQELNYTLSDLKMILDNTEQGFLTLDNQLRVEPTYSQECINIFNQQLDDVFFPTLLYPHDMKEAAFVEMIITTIQKEEDDLKRESYISLLPEKLKINGLFIELEYKWIQDAIPGEMQLMIILTDVTKRIELENRIEEERNKLSKIIKIMLNLEEFRRMGTDYRHFVTHDIKALLNKSQSQEIIALIKRRLHTYKGSFASFGLRYIEKKLHRAEEAVQDLSNQKESFSALDDLNILNEKEMCSWLEKGEEIIKNELANCIPCEKRELFRNDRFLRIYPEQIESVRKMLRNVCPPEYHEAIEKALTNLKKVKIKEFLNYYRYVVDNIAEKLGKTIHPLVIEGDDVYCDPEKIGKWTDTLIHIFRNAIDHGIETTEERIMLEKPQYGRITVNIKKEASSIRIEISDDGRGMDIQQITKRAIDRGFLDSDKVDSVNDGAILKYIFLEGFSTKDNVDLISGRGTGLSAVKSEWEKLGGIVSVRSEKDKGTTFIFLLQKPM